MLEKIREGSQGIAARVILGLVILTFALAGIGSYLGNTPVQPAARVNGEDILMSTLDNAYENERARMQAQMGQMFEQLTADPNYLKTFKVNILERLISEKLAEQRAADLGMRISDTDIKRAITQMPEFQTAGKFDNNRFLALLRQNGYQPESFSEYVRAQMNRSQLVQALAGSEFSLDDEVKSRLALQQQTRVVEFVEIKTDGFELAQAVTDEEVDTYYNANLAMFDTEEKVAVEYVQVSAELLAASVSISDDEVSAYYQDNIDSYGSEERRRIAHILIESGEDEAAASAKAVELAAKIKSGESFEELAKAESADIVSAENGGDLDWITRGFMEAEFDDAAFALTTQGEVSEVVKSSFGFHIIKLLDLEDAQTKSLEEVKVEIVAKLKSDAANDLFYERSTQLSETAFENPDTLEIAAEVVDAKIVTTESFSKGEAPAPLSETAVLIKLFDPEFIDADENSDTIELSDGSVIVVRVIEHQPVATKPLADVKAGIVDTLTAEKKTAEAIAYADQIQGAWGSDEAKALLEMKQLELTRVEALTRYSADADFQVNQAAFEMAAPAEGSTSLKTVTLSSGNAAVVSLVSINTTDVTIADSDRERLGNENAQKVYQAFLEAERANADVEIFSVL